MQRKLLVLTYEFPPTGGAGVQRVLKWCRYLPEFGWEPVVVTTSTGWSRPSDPALEAEVEGVRVIRTRPRNVAWSLARTFGALKGLRSRDAGSPRTTAEPVLQARRPLSTRIASWVTVPDPACVWIREATRQAVALGREQQVDAVLATLPPYSVGVAATRVARSLGVPLVTDLRDAWAGNVSHVYPTAWHRARSLALEGRVMRASSLVTAAAETAAEEATAFGAPRAEVVYNGFDVEVPRHQARDDRTLSLAFLGRFFAATDPAPLLEAIAAVVSQGYEVHLDVVGPEYSRGVALAELLGISDRVTWHGFMPREQALAKVVSADVGVIVLAHSDEDLSWYPLKAFEYLGMRLPSLVVGPSTGVTSRLIDRARAGWTVGHDAREIADRLARLAEAKRAGGIDLDPDEDLIETFGRRSLTRRLAELLDEVVGTPDCECAS